MFNIEFRDYLDNMKNVDSGIEEVVQRTEEYFGQGETAYIFTSDHGMTDWGSHGSGSTDETETPFVAWGAGLAKNPYLQHIEQADITPLASTLLGIPVPVNNEVSTIFAALHFTVTQNVNTTFRHYIII